MLKNYECVGTVGHNQNIVVNWNFALTNWHCPHQAENVNFKKVAAKCFLEMEAKDGSYGFWFWRSLRRIWI